MNRTEPRDPGRVRPESARTLAPPAAPDRGGAGGAP